ncbi:MAG: zinc dependent phospholipase C family protein [Christensenellales bacterium]
MPAVTAHYYFGQEVLRRLDTEIAAVAIEHKDCFDLGLQGPDLLFYYKPYKRNAINGLGIAMHDENASVPVSTAIESIRKTRDEKALAYLLGFVCHFVLDSSLHGDISRVAPTHEAHFCLEAEMDRQIIRLHYHNKPHQFKRHALVKLNTREFGWLSPIYPNISLKTLKKTCRSIVYYLKVLRTKGSFKYRLLLFTEKAIRCQGSFTSMIVCPRPREAYSNDAQRLCARFREIAPAGAKAVENIYACVKENALLLPLFDKNFE